MTLGVIITYRSRPTDAGLPKIYAKNYMYIFLGRQDHAFSKFLIAGVGMRGIQRAKYN